MNINNFLLKIIWCTCIIFTIVTITHCETVSDPKDKLIGNWVTYQLEAYSVIFNYEQGFTLKDNNTYGSITISYTQDTIINLQDAFEGNQWYYKIGTKDTLQFIQGKYILNYEVLQLTDSILEIRQFNNILNHFILYKYENSINSAETKMDENLLNYNIYPNPSNGLFKLSINEKYKPYGVEICDLHGRNIYNHVFIHDVFIDLSDRKRGVYLIKVRSGNLYKADKIFIN